MGSDGNFSCFDTIEEAKEMLDHLRTDCCKEERHYEVEHETYDDGYPEDYTPRPEREYLRGTVEDY
jgi:hypothetical protein